MICRKVKQVTGIKPLSVDLFNDVDVILELPNDALVTQVGQELQKVVEWGSYCRRCRDMDRDGVEISVPERRGRMTP